MIALPIRLKSSYFYPDKGDMRSVRPSIRAMEIGTRSIEFGEEPTPKIEGSVELPPRHLHAFWKELQETTQCVFRPWRSRRGDRQSSATK